MAFISYTYNGYDHANKQLAFTIVDSDFGEVVVRGIGGPGVACAVAKEYSKRGLNVGRNLALFVLYYHKGRKRSIADIKCWQDKYCPEYIENWDMCAKERDEALEKLLPLQ